MRSYWNERFQPRGTCHLCKVIVRVTRDGRMVPHFIPKSVETLCEGSRVKPNHQKPRP